jgi:hypothetical protein
MHGIPPHLLSAGHRGFLVGVPQNLRLIEGYDDVRGVERQVAKSKCHMYLGRPVAKNLHLLSRDGLRRPGDADETARIASVVQGQVFISPLRGLCRCARGLRGAWRTASARSRAAVRTAKAASSPFLNTFALGRYRQESGVESVVTIIPVSHISPFAVKRYRHRPRFEPIVSITHVSHLTPCAVRGYRHQPLFEPIVPIRHVSHVSPIAARKYRQRFAVESVVTIAPASHVSSIAARR